jgi:hypothetical protein
MRGCPFGAMLGASRRQPGRASRPRSGVDLTTPAMSCRASGAATGRPIRAPGRSRRVNPALQAGLKMRLPLWGTARRLAPPSEAGEPPAIQSAALSAANRGGRAARDPARRFAANRGGRAASDRKARRIAKQSVRFRYSLALSLAARFTRPPIQQCIDAMQCETRWGIGFKRFGAVPEPSCLRGNDLRFGTGIAFQTGESKRRQRPWELTRGCSSVNPKP